MFVFGGWGNGGYLNTLRVFDTETNCWQNMPSAKLLPGIRWGHSAFSYKGELYIIGGVNGDKIFDDLWKFNPESLSWKKVGSQGRRLGLMYEMCCCTMGDRIILFGEYNSDYTISDELYFLDLSPSLKTLCKLAVLQYGLQQSELPHDIRWELAAMTTDNNRIN